MILYFTGTGNSKYIATLLSRHLNDQLISLNDLIKTRSKRDINCNNDNLIIVTPTYAWRIPRLVNDYLSNIKINNAKNIYFVMSCGGEIGNSAKYNKELANKLNLNYKGSVGIKMPDNYIIMFKPLPEDECISLIKEAMNKILEVGNLIINNEDLKKPRNNLYDRLMSKIVNKQFYKYKISEKGFYVSDKCIRCGKCVEICPLNNIKLVDYKPIWENNCTHCMACLSYCPENAINYKNKTEGKKPYRIEHYINKL